MIILCYRNVFIILLQRMTFFLRIFTAKTMPFCCQSDRCGLLLTGIRRWFSPLLPPFAAAFCLRVFSLR